MKQRICISLFAVLVWFFPLVLQAQFVNLQTQLKDKKTFSEITKTVDQYLQTLPESEKKEVYQKHFSRWAYYMSLHLGPDNEFVNISRKNMEALKAKAPAAPDNSANGDWTFVGPSSSALGNPNGDIVGLGRADRIAFHPTNPNIFYVGTPAGGLWKTYNGGASWVNLSDFIPSIGISGIVVDHTHPDTVYVLTGDGDSYLPGGLIYLAGYLRLSVGVLVSYDGGFTWEQTGDLFTGGDYVGYRLVQHPTNSDILLAATSEGIYRTTNGGETWVQEQAGKYYDLEFKPGSPTRVYASGPGEFLYSNDAGDTWHDDAGFSNPLCVDGRVEIAVTHASGYENRVYLLAGPAFDNNTFCGFYLSVDSGSFFSQKSISPNVLGKEDGVGDQSDYDIGLTVSPINQDVVIAAGLVLYRSTNSGSTFNYATVFRESGPGVYIHPDVHAVEYNPLNGYLYALTDGGIYRSTDDGLTYTDLSPGLESTQFYGLADYDANEDVLLAGAQDNGAKYKTTDVATFDHIICCDVADVIINYTDSSKGYINVNRTVYMFNNFNSSSPSFLLKPGFFPQIEMNTSDPSTMYVGHSRIVKFVNGISQGFLGADTIKGWWALKTCPSNANKIYAAGGDTYYDANGKLFMSSDAGATWSTLSSNSGFPAVYNRISDIGVRPNNSGYVWVTFSGYTGGLKVYFSANSGSTWTNKSYDLPNVPVWTVEVDAGNNVYVGTEYGVFYLENGATSWEPFYNDLPNTPVTELALNETAGVVHAATFGRGIWKTTERAPCPNSYTVSGNQDGRKFYSASGSITMSTDVTGGEGTHVTLRAGDYVNLTAGFEANSEPGNKFLAYIGDCGSGMPPDFSFGNPSDSSNINGGFVYSLAHNLGTLEIKNVSVNTKNVIVRLFRSNPAKVQVFLTDEYGKFIRDITRFEGGKGKTEYQFTTEDLKPGLYYLYLTVNRNVNHLQELLIE